MKQVGQLSLVLLCFLVNQGSCFEPVQSRNSANGVLILIASRQAANGHRIDSTELLVIEASGDKINWRFACAPLPVEQFHGEVSGSKSQIIQVFKEVEAIERSRIRPDPRSIKSSSFYTLVLISDNDVSMCVGLNRDQRNVLLTSVASRNIFQDIRKKIYGVGYLVHDLLFPNGLRATSGPYGKKKSNDRKP